MTTPDGPADGVRALYPAVRAVLLVEGPSDEAALETLARRRGLDMDDVRIVAMGGVNNVERHLDRYGPAGADVRLAGLCDATAERYLAHRLERSGIGAAGTRAEMEELGFFLCDRDLEDELIRALGTAAVEEIIERRGELPSLRILAQQPAQRDRSTHQHLHRFMGSKSGRKLRYARLMIEALDPDRVPRVLDDVLDAVSSGPAPLEIAHPAGR